MAELIDLAPTPIARLIKQTLPPVSSNPHSPDNYRVSKELKAALQRAGGLFALYLAHTASEVSRETGRQQVTPEDVLGALEELDMDVLVQPTNEFVKAYRRLHLNKTSNDDIRPTRPTAAQSKKASGGGSAGGSSKRKVPSGGSGGGSSKAKKASTAVSAGKKVKANVDLTSEVEGEEAGQEEEGADGEQLGGAEEDEIEEGGQEAESGDV